MQVVKLFNTDNCQMLALPKDFEFDSTEVVIERCADGVLLRPNSDSLGQLLQDLLDKFDDDFKIEREELGEQIREEII
ncbi:MAG: AbrB/MazE/SpoVT family DNA-binding domain-containing protein [Cardiobacteriaceae bacterium]|nr:AbrB/MazE/SpoVT family DNA-binding domain-containing protein [Cardiobacteriaceae bacterium]